MKTNSAIGVFIAVLVAGAIVYEKPDKWFGDGARPTPAQSDFRSIGSALRTYMINAGHYPSSEQGLEALVERPTISPLPDDWVQVMTRVPKDPWRNEYHYRCFPEGSHHPFELISIGPDGVEGTKDDRSSLHRSHPISKP